MAIRRINPLQSTSIRSGGLDDEERRRRMATSSPGQPSTGQQKTAPTLQPPQKTQRKPVPRLGEVQGQTPQVGFTTSGGFNPATFSQFMSNFQQPGMELGAVPPQTSSVANVLSSSVSGPPPSDLIRRTTDTADPPSTFDPPPVIGGGEGGFTEGDLPPDTGDIIDTDPDDPDDVDDGTGPPGEMSDLEKFLRDIIFQEGEFAPRDAPFNEEVARQTQERLFRELDEDFGRARSASDVDFTRRGLFFSDPALQRQDILRGEQAEAQGDITSNIALEQARSADAFAEQQFQRRMQALGSLFGFGQQSFENQLALENLTAEQQQAFLQWITSILGLTG